MHKCYNHNCISVAAFCVTHELRPCTLEGFMGGYYVALWQVTARTPSTSTISKQTSILGRVTYDE